MRDGDHIQIVPTQSSNCENNKCFVVVFICNEALSPGISLELCKIHQSNSMNMQTMMN